MPRRIESNGYEGTWVDIPRQGKALKGIKASRSWKIYEVYIPRVPRSSRSSSAGSRKFGIGRSSRFRRRTRTRRYRGSRNSRRYRSTRGRFEESDIPDDMSYE